MASSLIIKKSKLSEVWNLAPRLRADDVREVIAAGSNPIDSLKAGYRNGKECFSVFTKEGLLIGMFGYTVPNIYKDIAIIWFLGSDEIEKYPLTFVKEGKKFINKLTKNYTVLNCVHSRNTTHINYIKRIGCEINFNTPVIINCEKFYPFQKKKLGELCVLKQWEH